jgi:two-component system OmpR family sensor kinase
MITPWFKRIKRFFLPVSLRYQLLSRSLFILAGLLLLIGLFQYVLMHDFIYKNKAMNMRDAIANFPRNAWEQLTGNTTNDKIIRRPPFVVGSSIAFIDLNGNDTALPGPDDVMPPKLSANEYINALEKKSALNYLIVTDSNKEEQLVLLQPVIDHGRLIGIVQVNTGTKQLKEILLRQLLTFLMLSTTALILGLLTFLPVLRKTLVPLSTMVDTVEKIDGGNLTERFPDHQGQLEIDRLAISFNGMLERLEYSFESEKEAKEQMRRFIADASHELRTPLTSIHGFLEVLLRGAASQPEQLDKALRSMYGESERINKLVQDLLLLAKLDQTPHMELQYGPLDDVIHDMEPQLRLLAGRRNVSFTIHPNLNCRFDPDKMKQVVLNLYYNAVQHTDADLGSINITLKSAFNGVIIAIQDNGTGIPREHLPYLFDRFYRSDSSRTRKYGGSGLGLSITKSIIEAHSGSIRVESSEGHGSTFTVWLPQES